MSAINKIVKELVAIFWTSLYFLMWFGSLMLIKVLLLEEYKIQFYGVSFAIIGALIVAKAVLILDSVPVSRDKNQHAWIVVLKRTFLFLAGVFIVLVIEKSIEGRHEYGGVVNAFKNLIHDANMYHVWVNFICVFGALLFYNLGSLFKHHIGKEGIKKNIAFTLSSQKIIQLKK